MKGGVFLGGTAVAGILNRRRYYSNITWNMCNKQAGWKMVSTAFITVRSIYSENMKWNMHLPGGLLGIGT